MPFYYLYFLIVKLVFVFLHSLLIGTSIRQIFLMMFLINFSKKILILTF